MKSITYKTAFLYSLGLHVVLVVFFLISFASSEQGYLQAKPEQTKIVEAVAVNQQMLNQEIDKIKNERLAAQQAEKQKVERLEQEAKAAEQKRLVEQTRLQQLKQAAEQERLTKLSKVKAEKKADSLAKEKKELAAARQKEKVLQDQLAKEQQELAASRQKFVDSIVAKYTAMIKNAIAQKWIIPSDVDKSLSCVLLINLLADGTVVSVEVNKSSGDTALDNSAVLAVKKASPLPMPDNAEVINQFKTFYLTVKPETVLEG